MARLAPERQFDATRRRDHRGPAFGYYLPMKPIAILAFALAATVTLRGGLIRDLKIQAD